MGDYYLEDEERFGFITSFLYSLCIRLPPIKRFYLFVADDLGKKRFGSMLDIGTGPGYVPIMLATTGKIGSIYAVDPSKAMVRIARARSKGLDIRFVEGSSRYVPFRTKFDLIISTLSFHHWKEKENSLSYLKKFLKKNGEIRIYEFEKSRRGLRRYFPPAHAVSRKEMLDMAVRARLRVKSINRRGGFIKVALVR